MTGNEIDKNLTRSLSHGGAWMIILHSGEKVLNLIKLIILAHILTPFDFGIVAVALVLSSALDAFSQTGFAEAIIQKKEKDRAYSDCAWSVLLIRGITLAAIMFALSGITAQIFKIPSAANISKLLALCFALQAFTNIGVVHLLKDLSYKKYFAFSTLAAIGEFIVSIAAAIILRNAMALVLGMLARDFLKLIISYMISPYRPHFKLNILRIRELAGFGKWMLGSSIFGFAITQIDSIMVARFLGASAIGSYQMAQKISNVPSTEITHIINQLTLPVYSKIQDNKLRLKKAYLKVLGLCSFFIFFLAGLIMLMGEDFINIFLGKKWNSLSSILIIMAVAGLVRAIAATAGAIFQAIGKPKIDTFWQSIRLFTIATLIYPFACWWGTLGAALALLASTIISGLGACCAVTRAIACGGKDFVRAIFAGFFSATISVLTVYILKQHIAHSGMIGFFSFFTVFTVAYLICTLLIDRWLNYDLLNIFKEIRTQFMPEN